MPLIQVTLIQGREPAVVTQCARDIARAVQKSLNVPFARIRVTVNEVPATHWLVGDRSKAEMDEEEAAASGAGKKA